METKPDSTLALLTDIVRCLDDKKAEDLRVLKVGAQSSITDYLVLATGTSEPHLRALRVELEKAIDQRKAPIAGMDSGEPGSGWTVVDAYQVMVHLFTAEKREQYRLENLWKDAQDVSLQRLLHPEGEAKAAPAAIPTTAATPAVDAAAGGNAPAAPEGAPASPVTTAVESAPIDQTVPTPANQAGALKAKPRARPAGKAKSGAASKTNATSPVANGGLKNPRTTPSSDRTSNAVGAKAKTASAPKKPLAKATPARTSKKTSSTTRASGAAKKLQSAAKAANAAKKASAPTKVKAHSQTKPKVRAAMRTTAGAGIKAPTKAKASAPTPTAAKASTPAGTDAKVSGKSPAKAESVAKAKDREQRRHAVPRPAKVESVTTAKSLARAKRSAKAKR